MSAVELRQHVLRRRMYTFHCSVWRITGQKLHSLAQLLSTAAPLSRIEVKH